MDQSNVYKINEIVGTSPDSIEAAINNAIERATKSLRNLEWFEVVETRGYIGDEGQVQHFQVTLKLGLRLEG